MQRFPVSARCHCGFSLVELLASIAILCLLSAFLYPMLLTLRGQARQTSCSSHLRQINLSLNIYKQDYDNLYPYALDPSDLYVLSYWETNFPDFGAQVRDLPLISQVLRSYSKSAQIFSCPSDTGFDYPERALSMPMNAFPSCYERYGLSYFFRTELAARKITDSDIEFPARINVLHDPVGYWHGTLTPIQPRYNVLFADGHVKNLTRPQIHLAWFTPLNSTSSSMTAP
jgi:general secretion pathway protein G